MAGENELSMDLLNLGGVKLPVTEEVIENPTEEPENPEKKKEIEEKKEEIVKEVINDLTAEEETPESVGRDEDTPNEEPETPADSDEVFQTLGEFLKEKGILSSLDKELKSEDDFAEILEEELKKREYSNLNEKQKFLLQELEKGVPTELVHEKLKTDEVYSNITPETIKSNEQLQEQLVIQDLLSQGWAEERAKKQVERLKNLGEIYDEAVIAKQSLEERDKAAYEAEVKRIEQEKQAAIEQEKKRLEELKETVYNTKTLFGEFEVSESLRQKAYDAMTKVVATDENGNPLNELMKARADNPVEFETKLYYLWELTNGFKDINKFTRKANSKAARKLKSALASSSLFKTEDQHIARKPEDFKPNVPIVDIT